MNGALDIFKTERDYTAYLQKITGHPYSFAVSSARQWNNDETMERGDFFQLMPDGIDDGFFDWYCNVKPYNQFFREPLECILAFVENWLDWKKQ